MQPHRPRFDWVATPPPGAGAPPARPRRGPYTGPPAYRTPPRWGFPALAWRWPTAVSGLDADEPAPVDRLRRRGRLASSALWMLAAVALLAAGAEAWRYVLLLLSRDGALSRGVVEVSDSLVVTGAVLALVAGLLALLGAVWWLFTARRVAADVAGYDPPRPDWQVLPALVVPLVNLVVPGSLLAELEHAVLRRPEAERPRPSPLVRWWWAAWAASVVLFTVTVVWRFRSGVQAEADGVLLNVLTDLAAAALAIATEVVVARFSALLAPVDANEVRRVRVVRVNGAPELGLRPRPATSRR
ncbi:putative conserved membrane protein [Actinokineospora spheciospongiae]|uniref:Putative conserved membrane protein n=1 Tax=Actinokineospora spheciospongiae TaxID=909613 RepID=W7IRC5_9PSEU|nr:DUF4328 domain-containing protein [Actinokineospora spheciospongiae]EWC62853.1 putative conserved membrane protein [Actinokineospora spheciospongiae]